MIAEPTRHPVFKEPDRSPSLLTARGRWTVSHARAVESNSPKPNVIVEATLPPLRNEQDRSPSLPTDSSRWAVSRFLTAESEETTSCSLEGESDTQFDKTDIVKVRTIDKGVASVDIGGALKMLDQQWECVVVGRDDETVHCELHDLSDPDNEFEYGEVFLTEFSEYDLPRLKEGAVFYWSIGRLREEHGQIRKFSELRLRPTPRISQSAQRRIAERARKLNGIFQRSCPGDSTSR